MGRGGGGGGRSGGGGGSTAASRTAITSANAGEVSYSTLESRRAYLVERNRLTTISDEERRANTIERMSIDKQMQTGGGSGAVNRSQVDAFFNAEAVPSTVARRLLGQVNNALSGRGSSLPRINGESINRATALELQRRLRGML